MKIVSIGTFQKTIIFNGQKHKYEKPALKADSAEHHEVDLAKVLNSEFASSVKLGELINSGTYANVYAISGWDDSYVARIQRDESTNQPVKFVPAELIPVNNGNVLYENPDKNVFIQKRIKGEPLHGKFWVQEHPVNLEVYLKTVDELLKLPDEVYTKYIDDVVELRKNGYDIDRFNPNNYLLDKEKKRINIVDLSPNYRKCYTLQIQDFYPFLDHRRILSVLSQLKTKEARLEFADKAIAFIDRMIEIARKKGFYLTMEEINHFERQSFLVHVYHKAQWCFK